MAPLQAFELPRTIPLPELPGRTETDGAENGLLLEAEAVEFAVEPLVARDRFGSWRAGWLHARHTARQQDRVGRGTLCEKLPVDDRPLGILGQEEGVAYEVEFVAFTGQPIAVVTLEAAQVRPFGNGNGMARTVGWKIERWLG